MTTIQSESPSSSAEVDVRRWQGGWKYHLLPEKMIDMLQNGFIVTMAFFPCSESFPPAHLGAVQTIIIS